MVDRRKLLELGLGCSVAGATEIGLGYRYGHRTGSPADHPSPKVSPSAGPGGVVAAFQNRAGKIEERQRQQTKETVETLKARYESPILGKFRVWDLLQKLAFCVDPTDSSLHCTSQYMHICQILAAMEEDGTLDETMLLVALLHDLGKIAMLEGEPPENVVCYIAPIEALEPAGGLDKVVFQFGHDEIAYSRFKDLVPEDVAWALRYHSTLLGETEPYMSALDQEYEKRILTRFRIYDQGTKSPANLPVDATLDRFRDFVESYFPQPILF